MTALFKVKIEEMMTPGEIAAWAEGYQAALLEVADTKPTLAARATECAHCGTSYRIGPGTSRTTRSQFCSDRCRVAAHRARAKAEAC